MTTLRALASATLAVAGPPAALASPDHWIYDADVVLYDDFDNDGFHHFLSVRVDADSLRRSTWVFAELYLSPDGVRWEHFYSTADFWIGGQTGDDEFFIETELQSGYPRGYYDLLVELYDADFVSYSDEFGPAQSNGMALLPLEDATQDLRPTEIVIVEADGAGGGGASSWLLTPALLAAGWRARRRFRRSRISESCAAE
jgi:hypothetical protein